MSSKNVAAKLIQAWGHIGSIPKNGKNANFNYKFVREEDAADALRHAFMKVGLACVPSVKDCKMSVYKTAKGVDMNHCIITMDFTLTDKDTGETETFTMVGEASDTADKAVYKAITGCTKYAYVKLAMSGAEDNEEEDVGPRTETGGDSKAGKSDIPAGGAKLIPQGTTYREPDKASEPAAASAKPDPKGNEQAKKADPQPATKQPVEDASYLPTMEDEGKITSVVPAMKNKPASISFKKKDGTVLPISFDPKVIDVPKILSFLTNKFDVKVICDISSGAPHLMSIEKV